MTILFSDFIVRAFGGFRRLSTNFHWLPDFKCPLNGMGVSNY